MVTVAVTGLGTVKPQVAEFHEALTYDFDQLKEDSAVVTMRWERRLSERGSVSLNEREIVRTTGIEHEMTIPLGELRERRNLLALEVDPMIRCLNDAAVHADAPGPDPASRVAAGGQPCLR